MPLKIIYLAINRHKTESQKGFFVIPLWPIMSKELQLPTLLSPFLKTKTKAKTKQTNKTQRRDIYSVKPVIS